MTDAPPVQYTRTSDGYSIAYQSFGEGPPLVWASGYWASHLSEHWARADVRRAMEGFAHSFTVYRYDGRGSGLSQREPFDFSLEARLRDLESVFALVPEGQATLIGTGHACLAAIAYAAEHPDSVSHLVLQMPYPRGDELYEVSPAMKLVASLRDVSVEQWEFVTLTIAQRVLDPVANVSVEEVAETFRAAMSPDGMLAFRDATRGIDVTLRLPEVRAPTLVLHTQGSAFTPLKLSQEVASSVENGELRVTAANWSYLSDDHVKAAQAFVGVPVWVPEPVAPSSTEPAHDVHTILFTDVEGSTALTDRMGDASARGVLREHERITRDALKAHGGSEVKSLGDGFMASFSSASKALECAVAIQRATYDHEVIRIRIGLNAGEPIAEGGDLFGTAVNMAARIAAEARGGEILVSNVVRELVAGKGFLFADRGETALRGFEDPVRVYEVRWRE